jgi:hypothetical protein
MKKIPNVGPHTVEAQEAEVAKMTPEQVIQRAIENYEIWHEMKPGTGTKE